KDLQALARTKKGELPSGKEVSGYIVWAKRPPTEKDKEVWELALRASWKGGASSGGVSLTPPQPKTNNGSSGSQTAEKVLRAGQDVTLVTLVIKGAKDGEITRKMVLKCKVLE